MSLYKDRGYGFSRTNLPELVAVEKNLTNFYEKARFVKVDLALAHSTLRCTSTNAVEVVGAKNGHPGVLGPPP
jgi:hypothetical protein